MKVLILFQPYKQIIPDWRYDQIAAYLNKDKKQKECNKVPAFQICLPCLMASNKVEKKNDEKKKETESPGILNSAAMKVNRLLLFLLVIFILIIIRDDDKCPVWFQDAKALYKNAFFASVQLPSQIGLDFKNLSTIF